MTLLYLKVQVTWAADLPHFRKPLTQTTT